MLWLKWCPKCNGDLYEQRDEYGRYVACFQCGYYLSEAEEVVLRYSLGSQRTTRAGEAATEELVIAGAGRGEGRAMGSDGGGRP